MSDSFMTIMIILIASILVFMVPMVTAAKRNDVKATQEVQATVTEFVDKVRVTGMIQEADYNNLWQELEASGNAYDVQIHIQQIDENPAKKSSTDIADRLKIGENIYYIEYTTQIEEAFKNSDDGIIRLSEGDYVKIDVVNVNQTLYQNFRNALYNLSNGKIGTIEGVHTGIVIKPTEGKQLTTINE